MRCSIPIPFYFSVQVLRPHPYFSVSPLEGEIPAEGSIDITISFHPITLGTCATCIKVHIMQHGFEAFETLVSARAISGALEQESLNVAQRNVSEYAVKRGSTINDFLGHQSSFRAPLQLKASIDDTAGAFMRNSTSFNRSKILLPGGPTDLLNDPVGLMLSSTFRAHDLPGALDNALRESLLGSTKKVTIEEGALTGLNKVLGESVHKTKAKPRGPGSGAVFDAGAQWLSSKNIKRYKQLQKAKQRLGPVPEEDPYTTVEGLRIPENLDTVGTVSFVITQETGKLKPKDLKAAIERNRAEKKKRAEEQQKIREQGGAGAGAGLDVRSILSEEKLNVVEGDAFKRQLREMAFLADVDDVNKEEIEKTFRTSEEYLGSIMLSDADIELIATQRKSAAREQAVVNWSRTLDRQHTELFPPYHTVEKAGSLKPQILQDATSGVQTSISILAPELSFDVNRNDVWAKRINTQRRFVSLVSRWIVRRRATLRLQKILDRLKAAGVTDKESCRAFVAAENSERVRDVGKGPVGGDSIVSTGGKAEDSVAALVCSMPNQALLNRIAGEAAVASGPQQFSDRMVRRNLFPKYFLDQSGERTPLDSCDIRNHKGFDDRTLFETKIRPEFITSGYEEMAAPTVPLFFPLCSSKGHREGAHEEGLLRPAADSEVMTKSLVSFLPPSMSCLESLMPPPPPELDEKGKPIVYEEEVDVPIPSWISSSGGFTLSDINFSRPRPDLRIYSSFPKRKEMDDDWALRPFGEQLEYDHDTSWAGSLLSTAAGFSSAHRYLFGGHEMRSGLDPPSASGPTLTDFYCPDSDRHRSGLNCFSRDHERTLISRDPDVPPATEELEREDILTDSESDDEDAYKQKYVVDASTATTEEVPSLAAARLILRGESLVKKEPDLSAATKNNKAKVNIETTGPPTNDSTDESFHLKEADRRTDQVELIRDRKILDMENVFKRQREKNADEITERLIHISEGSKCQLFALRVQRPFHAYHESVYSEVERLLPDTQTLFVEPPRRQQQTNSMMLTGDSLASPLKDAPGISLNPLKS